MPPAGRGILQLHPTRRCNLRCLHCYSNSGPEARDQLDVIVVTELIEDAVALGYTVLSVSGGEPLLYKPLVETLRNAKAQGMRTLATTNGLLLQSRRLDALADHLDFLAISLDGPADDHDRMRGRPGAFETMVRGLSAVREAGIPFGFLFTLTMHNVDQLAWAASFADDQGAALLQVHPLEASGRGRGLLESVPDEIEGCFALLEADRIRRQYEGRLRIQVDLVDRRTLLGDPEPVYGCASRVQADARLADLVSPLVVEPDGTCVPLEYGFCRSYQLGNICIDRLALLAESWLAGTYQRFHEMCNRIYGELVSPAGPQVVNWYDAVAHIASPSAGVA